MKIYNIGEIPEGVLNTVGGKARGLDFLKKNGFRIAEGFVICDAGDIGDEQKDAIYSRFNALNSPFVAVRSSATDEDGEEYSNAGQYETCLNVSRDGLIAAIEKCISSLNSKRAQSYSQNISKSQKASMNVVVQSMVQARCAGVAFTADPIAKGKIIIEAVEGLGENLVSGTHSASRYEIDKNNLDILNSEGILPLELLKELYEDVKKIRSLYDSEADIEWALDCDNTLWFLQLRPVTVTTQADIGEFNCTNNIDGHLITTRNIGEMLPGAITPLTISTSVLAIDYGIRNMLKKIGVIRHVGDRPDYYAAFPYYGHLFIDMSAIHTISLKVVATSVPAMNLSIMGEMLESDSPVEGKKSLLPVRLVNAVKFGKYLFSSEKSKKKLDKLCAGLSLTADGKAADIYREIDEKLPAMNTALSYHYVCSSFSGAMSSGLTIMFGEKFDDKTKFQTFLSRILSNIQGIESADILSSLRKTARLVLSENKDAAQLSEDELFTLIKNGSQELQESFNKFIAKHGHRSVKEAELRSKAWKNDTPALMRYLKTIMRDPDLFKEEQEYAEPDMESIFKDFKGSDKKAGIWLAEHSRKAVIDREYSKSRIIKVIDVFKDGYAKLAKRMREEGLLPDEDCIYFLTHKEIGALICGDNSLKQKAVQRRRLLREQESLHFTDVFYGKPEPENNSDTQNAEVLKGVPVFAGKVSGRARIVNSIEDADKLEEGEIMVAAFTDIGWSPYYSVIGGLVTEVGSALSHGAVVAREYALPTIVNVKNATSLIKSGDEITIDGERGEVYILKRTPTQL